MLHIKMNEVKMNEILPQESYFILRQMEASGGKEVKLDLSGRSDSFICRELHLCLAGAYQHQESTIPDP